MAYANQSTPLTRQAGPYLQQADSDPEFVKNAGHFITYSSSFYHIVQKQKENIKLTTFLARYHYTSCKTLWILILALPLCALNISFFFFFFAVFSRPNNFSPVFHRHFHQARLQIRSQCLTIFPHFSGTSYILLFCSLQVSMIFVVLCLYAYTALTSFEFDRFCESPGHKFLLEWKGTGPARLGVQQAWAQSDVQQQHRRARQLVS